MENLLCYAQWIVGWANCRESDIYVLLGGEKEEMETMMNNSRENKCIKRDEE